MNIKIACVGKIKEKFFRDALNEYLKRLTRYASIQIFEVADEKTDENASESEIQQIKDKEGERLFHGIKDTDYVIALDILGSQKSSEQFSKWMDQLVLHGNSSLVFVIGGSLGLSEQILSRADARLSFSEMTFPHQLMRVILLEQIYRSFRISRHEPYHK